MPYSWLSQAGNDSDGIPAYQLPAVTSQLTQIAVSFGITADLAPDDFENGIAKWRVGKGTSSTTSTRTHSGTHAYVTDEPTDVIYQRKPGATYQGFASVYFYDDASDTSLAAMARVDNGLWNDGTTFRALGVDTAISPTTYVYRVGRTETATTVTRTTGWHQFLWDYTSGTGVVMKIDGVTVTTATGITYFNAVAMGNWWGSDIAGTVYFDDFSFNAIVSDDFENGTGRWLIGKGSPSISGVQAHSGAYAYVTDEPTDVIYQRSSGVTFHRIASVYFYDDASDTSLAAMARVDNGLWNDGTTFRALGVDTAISPTTYVYRVGGTETATTVTRTTGWHQFRWDYTSGTGVVMKIDGVTVATATGITYFNGVAMGNWWGSDIAGTVYFDDFSIQ